MMFHRTTELLAGALALIFSAPADAIKVSSTALAKASSKAQMTTGLTHTITLHRNHMTYKLRQKKAMERLAARVGVAE